MNDWYIQVSEIHVRQTPLDINTVMLSGATRRQYKAQRMLGLQTVSFLSKNMSKLKPLLYPLKIYCKKPKWADLTVTCHPIPLDYTVHTQPFQNSISSDLLQPQLIQTSPLSQPFCLRSCTKFDPTSQCYLDVSTHPKYFRLNRQTDWFQPRQFSQLCSLPPSPSLHYINHRKQHGFD